MDYNKLKRNIESNNLYFFVFICALCCLNFGLLVLLAHHRSITDATCQWDCFWYTDIVKNGYAKQPFWYDQSRLAEGNWAFFPLYPAIAYAFHSALSIPPLAAELLVNVILWPILIYLCHMHLRDRSITLDRIKFAIFFVIFPFNLWYTSEYSEGVYGTLLILILILLQKNYLKWAAFFCFLIGLSRPTGFISVAFIAAWLFFIKTYVKNQSLSWKNVFIRLQESTLLVSAAGAGLSLYVLYLFHLTGDGFAFSHVEVAWFRKFDWLPVQFVHALKEKNQRSFVVFSIFVMYVLYKMYKKKWYFEASFMTFIAFIAASTGLQSIERYALSNPLVMEFLALSTLSQPPGRQKKILALLLVLHIVAIKIWFHGKIWFV